MPVADVLDLSEMELVAKVGELDRANLVEGQEALIQLDALAGKVVHGKIKSLSATASANVQAGDPSKKFDVLFSIDMQELLKVVGATPEQIREVMATAERNRSRPVTRSVSAFAMMGGGPEGGMDPSAAAMMFGMQQPGAQMGGRGGRGGTGGGDAAQAGGRGARVAFGGTDGAQAGGGRTRRSADQGGDAAQAGGGRGGANGQAAGGRGGGVRGEGGPGFGGGRGGFSGPTDAELANAKLPPPPEETAGVQILLRPGLLADVEIVVERIPNAINIPAQAVFEKEGRPVVFVQAGKGFEERAVKLLRRSESTMVISEGLKLGEVIALSDPTAGTGSKKGKKSDSGASPMDVGASAPKS
jgi:hypothetical protein